MLSILASYQKYISFVLNSHPNNNLINSRMYRIAVDCIYIYIYTQGLSPCVWLIMTTTNFGVRSSFVLAKKAKLLRFQLRKSVLLCMMNLKHLQILVLLICTVVLFSRPSLFALTDTPGYKMLSLLCKYHI